jgi:pimeloyl-ACP methyl ester carboxylesterase
VLPAWYGPKHDPPLPLVISPHGRGIDPSANARLWGKLPAEGPFAVVNPGGEGRKLALYSWGYRGQIDDLARMPAILHETLPWLHIDNRKVFAIGGSMGGQEVLLLVAEHPHLLAGAAAFDAPTNMALRYADFLRLENGRSMQALAAFEIGGTPTSNPDGYAARSPLDFAAAIARSGVRLQLWWSVSDQIVVDQAANSGELYQRIHTLDPAAPVTEIIGCWMHSEEMTAGSKLPVPLLEFGLLPNSLRILLKAPPSTHATQPRTSAPLSPTAAAAPVSAAND